MKNGYLLHRVSNICYKNSQFILTADEKEKEL